MEVQGKSIKIVTGSKTQTVNVYGNNDVENVYSHKVRLPSPADFVTEDLLAQRGFATIADMVSYLETYHHGKVETEYPSPISRTARAEVSSTWCDSVAPCVEAALNAVVTDFLTNPYRHRVEHSLHCQLYMELLRCPELNGTHSISLNNIGFIHKEYPETSSRPDKSGRRGNFDMVLIGPVEEAPVNLTIMDFMLGLIKPGIAIEVGLDYGASHLHSDGEKLKHSQIKRGYLLHLARETGNPQDDGGRSFLETYQAILDDEDGPQLVMCAFHKNQRHLKLLDQPLSVTSV